jgi:hypothetical protein
VSNVPLFMGQHVWAGAFREYTYLDTQAARLTENRRNDRKELILDSREIEDG